MSALDKVAEAIALTDRYEPWHWDELSDGGKDEYRQRAQAVLDALKLTEERRTNAMSSAGMTIDSCTGIAITHSDIRYDTRLVSPWVRADGGEV